MSGRSIRSVFWVSSAIFAVIVAGLQRNLSHHWTVAIVGGFFLLTSVITGATDLVTRRRTTHRTDVHSPTPPSRNGVNRTTAKKAPLDVSLTAQLNPTWNRTDDSDH